MKRLFTCSILLFLVSCSSDPNIMYQSEKFSIYPDGVIWQDEEAKVVSPTHLTSTFGGADEIAKSDDDLYHWRLTSDISNYPSYSSDIPLLEAMYNLSLEELEKNRTPDKELYNTGAKWEGVWTRDVSYSFLLSLALLDPETAKRSLMKKVKNGMIVQDTGSGGSWPISTDRLTWVPSAWEIYLVTGDKEWLETIFPIIQKTLEADSKTIFYNELATGESSFLDWREQSYPKWMLPIDIYRSENLGTNVVHAQTYKIMSEIAEILGSDSASYLEKSQTISDAINDQLWMEQWGYYAQFKYGRYNMSVSPRSEALGEALAVLFDVADASKAEAIFLNAPVTDYGVTCFWPQIPNMRPYHNNGIWPFVQGYWNWGAAKANNEKALQHGLASLYRAAAMFLTNKENMVAETGFAEGTAINSDRQLWSVAANLAMTYRVFLGMTFEQDRITFSPKIPKGWGQKHEVRNLKYRDAILNIKIEGHGNVISSIDVNSDSNVEASLEDGKASLPSNISGAVDITISVVDEFPESQINLEYVDFAPETPVVEQDGNFLSWEVVEDAAYYEVYRSGELMGEVTETSYQVLENIEFAEYQVKAISEYGLESFLSEPQFFGTRFQIEAEKYANLSDDVKGFTGKGYVKSTMKKERDVTITVNVREAGEYHLRFRYSNAVSSMCCDNKTGLRSLKVNDKYIGTAVFPIIEGQNWENWNFSNIHSVELKRGRNTIQLDFEDHNLNMDGEINEFLLDHVELWKLYQDE